MSVYCPNKDCTEYRIAKDSDGFSNDDISHARCGGCLGPVEIDGDTEPGEQVPR